MLDSTVNIIRISIHFSCSAVLIFIFTFYLLLLGVFAYFILTNLFFIAGLAIGLNHIMYSAFLKKNGTAKKLSLFVMHSIYPSYCSIKLKRFCRSVRVKIVL